MKLEKRIEAALELDAKVKKLLCPVSKKVSELLEDDSAHIGIQPGDGAVIVYRKGMDNSCLAMLGNIDELLTLNKVDFLDALDRAGI